MTNDAMLQDPAWPVEVSADVGLFMPSALLLRHKCTVMLCASQGLGIPRRTPRQRCCTPLHSESMHSL